MATEAWQNPSKSRAAENETPKSKYPNQEVWQFSGGCRVVVGQEGGKECMKFFHPSGSYSEYFPDGSTAQHTVGPAGQYFQAGMHSTTDENDDKHGSGHVKVTMGGGVHIEVSGDAGILVAGKTSLTSLGPLGLAVKGNMYMGVDGDMNMNVTGNMNTLVGGTNYVGGGAPMTVQATQLNLNPADGASGYTPGPGPGIVT